ncbi:MAG: prepilin peptidase [Roseburia sp.]|nr:prepilin peptidase [Roseburia sp.]
MWNTLKNAGMFIYLLLLSYFDCREKKVPCVLLTAGGTAVILAVGLEVLWGEKGWIEAVYGLFPGCLLILTSVLTRKAGMADGIVLLVLGAAEGFKRSLLLLCGSLLLLASYSIVLILLRRAKMNSTIPYLPFVCIVYGGMHFI